MSLAIFAFCVNVYSFQIIDFEPPFYTPSQGLPAPWTTEDDTGITDVNPISGTQSLYLGYWTSLWALMSEYPLTAPEGDTFTFSFKIRPAVYNPGYQDPGLKCLGGFRFEPRALGRAIGEIRFETVRPSSTHIQPSHYQIKLYDGTAMFGINVGNYVNWATYTITYNINWVEKTSHINIEGTCGLDLDIEVDGTLQNINKSNLDAFGFIGHDVNPNHDWNTPTESDVLFDDIIIGEEPEEPEELVGDFNSDGVVDYEDFAVFADCWLSELGDANWNEVCNLDSDGDSEEKIDLADLLIFSENWLNSSQN